MSLSRFSVLIFLLLASYGIVIEIFYYAKLKVQFSELAYEHIEKDLLELSEAVAPLIADDRNAPEIYQQMDWVTFTNRFVDDIVIASQNKILYSSNINSAVTDSIQHLDISEANFQPQKLFEQKRILVNKIEILQGREVQTLSVGFTPNYQAYEYLLAQRIKTFFIYFIILPFIGVLIFIEILRRYIIKPLNQLVDYAFNPCQVLPASPITELNSIYLAMKKAFAGLEDDKRLLYQKVRTDSLTGLCNRLALKEHITELVNVSDPKKRGFSLLFFDFDDFKYINDSLGHDKGDHILCCAAKALQSHSPSNSFLARVGGDEFVMLVADCESKMRLEKLMQALINALLNLGNCCHNSFAVSCSIGVCCYPENGKNYVELMQKADIAMYEAKRLGKGRYYFYSPQLNERVQKNIELDHSMRQALQNQEFVLYYQPKIDLKTKTVVGAEALIRWIKPNGEVISPADFIPIAELNGFIVQLGEWVLEAAFTQLQLWSKRLPDCVLSINVSARQLAEPGFCDYLKSLLAKYQLDPKKIDLEVTEYLFFDHSVDNLKTVNAIKSMGFSISLDDFGTGFSSLSYLKKFHVDQIKIDKSFIDDFDSESGAIFIETIVKMSESLKKQIIAEGVETASQAEYLQSVGCINVQGFLFSKPLPLAEFERYYQKHKPAVF